ncbi:cell division inhibitor SepF [Lachnospiraceae bacterium KH1T2]|nr:cell division inhibitor SepF [Lachnospiraceae bacterium KH1T2]
MSILDKFVKAMNINDEDDYDDYEDEYLDDEDEEIEDRKRFTRREEPKPIEKPVAKNKITPMRQVKKRYSDSGREVVMFKPTSSDESCDVMDSLLADRTVVLNLEGINEEIAQKIIDTVSGACYALNGNMVKISNYIFIVAPRSVELSGNSQGDVLKTAFDMPLAVGRM